VRQWNNKGRSNVAKGDIACMQRNLVFYRIRQVAARSAKFGPNFGGRGGHRGSAMVPFERAMVVSFLGFPL